MLDINFIRENPEKVRKGVKDKGYNPKLVDQVLEVDKKRRQLIGKIEKLRAERNKLTKDEVEKGRKIKEILRQLEPKLQSVEEELRNLREEQTVTDNKKDKTEKEQSTKKKQKSGK